MILKASKTGLRATHRENAGRERRPIRQKVNSLDGISPETVELLKNKHMAPSVFKVLKKMKPLRQVEVAELLVAAGNFSMPYVKALYAATNGELLIKPNGSKKLNGLSPEQMARMEREIAGLQRDLKLIEESYGIETITLVLARAYLLCLLGNNRVMRYLSQLHGDPLAALKSVIEEAAPEVVPADWF